MIVELIVVNVGLIERAELSFSGGLQVITGETGVGKTMLLSSLAIIRGERARIELIRAGCEEAFVSAFFRVESPVILDRLEAALGRSFPDGEILIERTLRRSGRHRNLLNGREVPLSLIRECGDHLLEIHGQRSQLTLLENRQQLELLDRYAGTATATAEFRAAFREARGLADRIDEIVRGSHERDERRLLLEHIVSDLASATLVLGEREQLERDLELLEQGDRIQQVIGEASLELYEGEDSLVDRLSQRIRQIEEFADLHPGLAEAVASCDSARAALTDAVRSLRAFEDSVDADPGALAALRSRHEQLVQLEERYRRRGDELVTYRDACQQELAGLLADHTEAPRLEEELRARLDDLGQRSRALGRKRRTAARRLAAAVTAEMAALQMPHATFAVTLEALDRAHAWHGFDETGGDRIEFVFGPNPGEPPQPLRATASGGELSRVMLSLKKALADADDVPVLVFDEIDTGVGGRLGAQLGRKLREIGESHQVLCVTHLPQIASFGRSHFRVIKEVRDGRTHTLLEALDEERRVEEIAAMMRGDGRTETSLAEARAMMAESR
ncbi:MAG: DNA repair protein RecN [Planctomycetota bacterium]